MVRNRHFIAILLILAVAASLRLTGLDWDGYQHHHPDERYLTWVATTIEAPTDLATAFAPRESTFNPFYWPADAESEGIVVLQDQPRSFAYGHAPLYLGVLATRVVERVAPAVRPVLPAQWLLTRDLLNAAGHNEFDHLTAVVRALTALVDVGSVWLVYLLGRQLFGRTTGLLAAALLALNVMHVQLAHFFAVDPYLTFFTLAAVYGNVRLLNAGTRRDFTWSLILSAVAIGLAVGSKFSAILLVLPFLAALALRDRPKQLSRRGAFVLGLGLVAVTFALTNPFALLDWTCEVVSPRMRLGPLTVPALDWRSCYLDNVTRQSAMVRGDFAFDFTRQYVGTWPYLYPVVMQLRWGMGYLLGVPAFAGFAWAIYRGLRRLRARKERPWFGEAGFAGREELVTLAWTLPYFLVTGSFFAKFMRYMQPLTPFLMIYAAAILWRISHRGRRYAAIGLVLLGTALYAVAFVNMYAEEHPWNAASRWMYENVPAGALIAGEMWDDPLPSSMEIDGRFRNRHIYQYTELTWLSGTLAADDVEKLTGNLESLAQAEYVTLSSNRGYGVVARLPGIYPLSHQYYERLFSGDLGFEVVFVTGRSPQLAGVALWPDRFGQTGLEKPPLVRQFLESYADLTPGKADESFTVYDQPMPIILHNREQLTVDEMLQRFELP
ncbi:MAG: ArnT family glycosyltransferase [Chloroflexota bacterium]